ncbi:MAG: hypothetical protein HZB56_14805 [Deltaproteobacteria bacterium]|nr:hypothetical protein [Deltaproteobacteria bacterium]
MLAIARAVALCCLGAPWIAGEKARAGAPGPEVLLVGQSDPALDVPAVQAAVSAGGTVALSGVFDFGATGRVVLTRDVRIVGRRGAVVRGGQSSFLSPLPPLPVARPGPAIAITHLTLEGATYTPIHIGYASSVEVSHNTIRSVVPRFNPALGFSAHAGVVVGTYSMLPPAVVPGAITGRVSIRHNAIEMSTPAPAATLCEGVFVNRTWGAQVRITGNTISDCARNSIETLDNHRDPAGDGGIEISHNWLRSQSVGVAWPNPFRPNGIVAGWFFDPTGAIDPARNAPYRISENRIDLEGAEATGIFAPTSGAVIDENRIAIAGANARGIVLGASDGLLAENDLAGSGRYAIDITPFYAAFPSVVADRNTVACNDVSRFQAGIADLHLAGNDNTVMGFAGTVLDTGTGNQVVGGSGCERECD